MAAMRKSSRCALARWAWKGKQYVVQVRAAEDGLVLQQLLFADEVRSMKDLDIEKVDVSASELGLALQLIDQIAADTYDPSEFADEEKQRVLAAIDEKIAGKHIVTHEAEERATGGQVIDLMDALRASLGNRSAAAKTKKAAPIAAATPAADVIPAGALKERKGVKRAPKVVEEVAAPVRARARK
jgi:DNA end-binding protein Ku